MEDGLKSQELWVGSLVASAMSWETGSPNYISGTSLDAYYRAAAIGSCVCKQVSGISISGANVNATMISGPSIRAGSLIAPVISGVAVLATTGSITNVVATTIVSRNGRNLSVVGCGSPTPTYGKKILAGYNAVGAGSNLWLKFPALFTGAPNMVMVAEPTAAGWASAPVGSWNAGSCFILSKTASLNVQWVAIGDE